MRKITLVLVAFLVLPGCAQIQKVYDIATSVSVSPTAVIVAGNIFDGLEKTAANYLRLPRCPEAVICSDKQSLVPIKKAIRSGRDARDRLEVFLATHPGELGPSGLYDALIQANDSLKNLFYIYNIK